MDFVSRSDWGARFDAGFGPRPLPLSEAWLHHSVTLAPDLAFQDLNGDSTDDDEAAAMRAVEAIGQQRFGGGFSYNVAVMPSGRLYVGCGVRRVGSHTHGRNTRALGVVLIGNYEANPVPDAMRHVLPDLLRFAKAEGWLMTPRFTGGHRDLKKTACPGLNAYRLIPEINNVAAGAPRPGSTTPPPVRLPSAKDTDMARLFLDPDGVTVWACNGTNLHHVPDQAALARGRRLGYYPADKPVKITAEDLGAISEQFAVAADDSGGLVELPDPAFDPEPAP